MRIAVASSFLVLVSCGGSGQRAIRPGDSFERELRPGDTHIYSVALGAGESAFVVVNQMGIDVIVDVIDPAGKVIASVDSPNGRNGDEPVLLEPEARGTYLLRVRPIDANEPVAKYSARYPWRRDAQETGAVVDAARRWLADACIEIP